jgi:hypothetical protein
VTLLLLPPTEIQIDTIVLDVRTHNQTAPTQEMTRAQLKYLLSDYILQASRLTVVSRDEFEALFPHKVPRATVEVVLDYRSQNVLDVQLKVIAPSSTRMPFFSNSVTRRSFAVSDEAAFLRETLPAILAVMSHHAAIPLLRETCGTSNWDAFQYFHEGERAFGQLDITRAKERFRYAAEIDSSFVLPRLRLASALVYEGGGRFGEEVSCFH